MNFVNYFERKTMPVNETYYIQFHINVSSLGFIVPLVNFKYIKLNSRLFCTANKITHFVFQDKSFHVWYLVTVLQLYRHEIERYRTSTCSYQSTITSIMLALDAWDVILCCLELGQNWSAPVIPDIFLVLAYFIPIATWKFSMYQ